MVQSVSGIKNVPNAVGPYSQAAVSGNLIFFSGQVGLNPETGSLVEGGIEAQTTQVLENISAALTHFGLKPANVIKSLIFLSDMDHFKTVNGIYGDWLGEARPARSTVQVAALPLKALVEIEVIAERS